MNQVEGVRTEKARCEPALELDQLAHAVIGAAIEVHRVLGPGFLESVYESALAIELDVRGIRFERQAPLQVSYKAKHVGSCRLDLMIEGRLIVELKAVETLAPIHKAQVLSYLKATGLPLGLLINFNVPILRDGIQRVVLTASKP
jgi:GxxExxY protein